ncbi:unnamed protein product [Musa hybrid cultivar]
MEQRSNLLFPFAYSFPNPIDSYKLNTETTISWRSLPSLVLIGVDVEMMKEWHGNPQFDVLLQNLRRKRSKIASSASTKSARDDREWPDLPKDIVDIIVMRLSTKDYARFASVCRSWRPCMHPDARPMCLMLLRWSDGACNVFDPSSRRRINYDAEFPELARSQILYCRDGWLLLKRWATDKLFFFHLGTRSRSNVPYHPRMTPRLAAFSSPPLSGDCVVVVLDDLCRIFTWRSFDSEWRLHGTRIKYKSNLVPCGRHFHCLCQDGQLGTLDAADKKWSIRDMPAARELMLSEGTEAGRHYLAEFDGGLYMVFVSARRRHVRVFKLRRAGATEEIEMLGNRTIYISAGAAHMAMAPSKEMGNRIYFPTRGSSRGSIHYYCMVKRRYSYSVDFVMPRKLHELYESNIERVWIDVGWKSPKEFEQFGR